MTLFVRATGCVAESTGDSIVRAGLIAIENNSSKVVDLRELSFELKGAQTFSSVPNAGTQQIHRITSCANGEEVPLEAFDTGSASLPAAVLCRRGASVTLGSLYSQHGQLRGVRFFLGTTSTGTVFQSRQQPGRWGANWWAGKGSVEPFVLREGEGFVWRQAASVTNMTQHGRMVFRNQSSGETYSALVRNVPDAPQSNMLALFNGSGSGVVLEVLSLDIVDVGQMSDGTTTFYEASSGFLGARLLRCQSVIGGEEVAIESMDSNVPAPSGLRVVKNVLLRIPEVDPMVTSIRTARNLGTNAAYGPLYTTPTFRALRPTSMLPTEVVQPDSSDFLLRLRNRQLVVESNSPRANYLVSPGECLALGYYFRYGSADAPETSITSDGTDDPMTMANFTIELTMTTSTGDGNAIKSASTLDAQIVG